MAKCKINVETLMMYSGHTTPVTLWRYLNYGEEYGAMQEEMAKAGVALNVPDSDTDSETE